MQFIDLQTQYQQLKNEIDEGIQEVLGRSDFIMGTKVRELEERLADYVGVGHCISCGNGTDALLLALKAYDVKQGDAVFVPTFTFFATAEAVSACGATPVFVDIDLDTYNISPCDLEQAITEVTREGKLYPRAIIAVDLFGLPCDYKKLKPIADNYNLLLLEDGAQGFGGSMDGRKACSFGDIATTSFFPSKPLGCYGDGGAVFTDEPKVKDYLESLRVHGKSNDKYDNIRIGMNSRLDTIQAAILLPKLKAFKNYELEARKAVASTYDSCLDGIVKTPFIPEGFTSSYAQYSILLDREEQRDKVQNAMKLNDIPTMIYYRKSMHQQTTYRNNPYIFRGFPNSEKISKTILNLPINPYLGHEDIMKISKIIKENA